MNLFKKTELSASPALRALCFVGLAGMAAQLLLLAEPKFAVAIVNATWDKAIHFLYFGTMAFLLWVAAGRRWFFAVWIAVAVIGVADETLQAFTPGRDSDVRDWVADCIGAATILFVARYIFQWRPAKLAPEKQGAACAGS